MKLDLPPGGFVIFTPLFFLLNPAAPLLFGCGIPASRDSLPVT